MEFLITLLGLAFIEAVLLAVICLAAGICSIFGCRFRKTFRKGLWLLLLPPLLAAYGALIERNRYNVIPIEITSEEIPEAFDGYRIVQISDLHLNSFRSRHRSLGRAVDKINSLKPDMIAMTGDLITFNPSEISGCDTILSRLYAPDGVFSVLGNHDYCVYDRRSPAHEQEDNVRKVIGEEKAMGWKVLINGHENLIHSTDTLSIIGVENTSASPHFPSKGDLAGAMEGAEGKFKILLSHDPTHWRMEVAGKSDIDLMLSGHTHAMQLSFFGWSPSSLMFKEYRGLYFTNQLKDKENNIIVYNQNKKVTKKGGGLAATKGSKRQYLYVNIGLGETGFPVRIGTTPEITLITLHRGSGQE